MLNGIDTRVTLSLPHNYTLALTTDFADRFRDTALKLDKLSVSANLDFDVDKKTFPDTFTSNMYFAGKVGVKAQVLVDYTRSLDFIINNLVALTPEVSSGCHF